MERKQFRLIAEVLKGRKPEVESRLVNKTSYMAVWWEEMNSWQLDCIDFANMCQETNERFDRNKFFDACGWFQTKPDED